MRNLLSLFSNFGGLLMFLFLEGVCFFMVVTFNTEQNQIALSSANRFVGGVYDRFTEVRDYLFLDRQHDQLLKENQQMMARIEALQAELVEHKELLRDLDTTFRPELTIAGADTNYTFIGAKIINNSITSSDNLLTLNKGRRDGVTKHAGVIGGNGIVGIIRNVSDRYSSVMSLLHRQTRISAAIQGTNHFGNLIWKSEGPRRMRLEAIPKYAEVKLGSVVVTSGFSYKFPPGVIIGEVVSVDKPDGDNFLNIEVELANDLNRLEYGYVTVRNDREALESLESSSSDE